MSESLKERLERIYMQKEAGFWNAAKSVFTADNLGRTIGGMGVAAAGTLAIAGGTALGQKALEGIGEKFTKPRQFKNMMDNNKHLQKNYDRKDVNKAFNALYALNPSYAKEPTIAGSMVGQMLNSPGFNDAVPHVQHDFARSIKSQDARIPAGEMMAQQLMKVRPFDPGDVEHQRNIDMAQTRFDRDLELARNRMANEAQREGRRLEVQKELAEARYEQDTKKERYKAQLRQAVENNPKAYLGAVPVP